MRIPSRSGHAVFLLLLVMISGVIFMPRQEYPGDPLTWRCEAISILRSGTIAVPATVATIADERGQYFFENVSKGLWFSKYGPLNAVISIPPLLLEALCEGDLPYFSSRRVIYLNLFNVLLAAASALLLHRIALRHAVSPWSALLFCVAALYCTFWWNYLRAQNSEIYQTLLLLAFYDFTIRAFPGGTDVAIRKPLLLSAGAGCSLGALILVKMAWLAILPPVLLLLVLRNKAWFCRADASRPDARGEAGIGVPRLAAFLIPVFLSAAFLFGINYYKFGSVFESGYGQWQKDLLDGSLLEGLRGFLLSVHKSIFIAFPLLLFALFGYGAFLRKYRWETLLVLAMGGVLLLVSAKFPAWTGGYCYGPRYLLPVLPLLALPALHVLDRLFSPPGSSFSAALATLLLTVLGFSFWLQCNVNALDFLVYYRVKTILDPVGSPEIKRYFDSRPFGLINSGILAFRRGGSWAILENLPDSVPRERVEEFREFVRHKIHSNYYCFPLPGDSR